MLCCCWCSVFVEIILILSVFDMFQQEHGEIHLLAWDLKSWSEHLHRKPVKISSHNILSSIGSQSMSDRRYKDRRCLLWAKLGGGPKLGFLLFLFFFLANAHCKILPLERTLFYLEVETKYDYGVWLATYSCALCTIQIMSPSPKLWETEFQTYGIFLKTINFSNFSTKNHSEW